MTQFEVNVITGFLCLIISFLGLFATFIIANTIDKD